MKATRLLIFSTLLTFLGAGQAFANDPGNCGLPSIAIKNSTINILVNFLTSMPTYTLGVTSGTSGCKGMVLLEKEREFFVRSTYDELSEEAAQGGGQHLETLAGLMGCNSATGEFAKMTQSQFGNLFADAPESPVLINRLKAEIGKNPSLQAQCKVQIG